MPIPMLNATPGASDANTFADLTFYKTYIVSRRPQPAWAAQADAGLIDADLTIDLLASCEILNASLNWTGQPATDTQALIVPGLSWRDRFGRSIPDTDVPIEMKRAQCELAVQLHEDALTKSEGSDLLSDDLAAKAKVKRVSAGPVAVEFQGTSDSLEALSALSRLEQAQFNYLNVIPRAVRLLLVPSWYVEAELQKGFIFEKL